MLAPAPVAGDNGIMLSTPRLILRDFNEDDFAAVHDYASDPLVTQYMEWGPNKPEDTHAFLQRKVENRRKTPRMEYDFAVVLKGDAALIGSCAVALKKPEHREAMLGYVFNRHYWGQGIATEAARAVVNFAFEELHLHRVAAMCNVHNPASARVMEKLGMQREGRLREHCFERGRWQDSFLYAVLEQEWKKSNSREGVRASNGR